MEDILVKCPETGCLEQTGCLVARDGEPLVVLRCTRFEPPQAITCETPCIQCRNRYFGASRDPWRLPDNVR